MNKLPLILLQNIHKNYTVGTVESHVLKSITLQVDEKELIAIIGASGSGKSTLMNIMGFLDKADQGTYHFRGHNTLSLDDDQRAILRNQSIGFVFQQFNLLSRFTALQNVALPLTYREDLSASTIHGRALDALAHVGMKSFAAHRPTQLSGGQQQRVAIARALVGDPQIIFADEPTGSLDSATGKEIMALFSTLHQEGRTLIIVSHDPHIAQQCPRQITIADGHIIHNGDSCA